MSKSIKLLAPAQAELLDDEEKEFEREEARTQHAIEQEPYIRAIQNIDNALARPFDMPDMQRKPRSSNPLKNLGNDILLGTKQHLGMAPSRRQVEGQMRAHQYKQDMLLGQRDRFREALLRKQAIAAGIDPQLANSTSAEALEELLTSQRGGVIEIPGVGFGQRNLSTNQLVVLGQNTGPITQYEYHVKQMEKLNQNLPPDEQKQIPTFTEYTTAAKVAQSHPAAVGTWNYMLQQFPDINDLSEEEKMELFLTVMRQGQSADYAFDRAKARSRGGAGGLWLTPGQEKADEAFAVEAVKYQTLGGDAQVRRNFQELEQIIKQLKAVPANQTSDISGLTVATLTDPRLRSAQSVDIQNMVERIVTQDLRQTLGAQFTEEEAKKFVSYAYNLALHPSVNAKRLARMRNALKQTATARSDAMRYWDKFGSISGFEAEAFSPAGLGLEASYGAVFTPSDFDGVTNRKIVEMIMNHVADPDSPEQELEVLMEVYQQRGLTMDAINTVE